jgi:hypothetical protein
MEIEFTCEASGARPSGALPRRPALHPWLPRQPALVLGSSGARHWFPRRRSTGWRGGRRWLPGGAPQRRRSTGWRGGERGPPAKRARRGGAGESWRQSLTLPRLPAREEELTAPSTIWSCFDSVGCLFCVEVLCCVSLRWMVLGRWIGGRWVHGDMPFACHLISIPIARWNRTQMACANYKVRLYGTYSSYPGILYQPARRGRFFSCLGYTPT